MDDEESQKRVSKPKKPTKSKLKSFICFFWSRRVNSPSSEKLSMLCRIIVIKQEKVFLVRENGRGAK